MPQLRKYILRGCGIFVLVLLVSAKNGDRIVRSLCFVCREPSGVWLSSLMLPALSLVPFLVLVLVPAQLFQTLCRFSAVLLPRE